MARYIDRDKALSHPFANGKYDHKNANEDFIIGFESYKEWLEQIPIADVQEVRHGKWQMKPLFNSHIDESDVAVMIRCSGCGMKLIAQKCGPFPNYCANCGAKNDAERGDDGQK